MKIRGGRWLIAYDALQNTEQFGNALLTSQYSQPHFAFLSPTDKQK